MGIVIKQGSISGIITYLGAFIGFINSVILFPAFLSTEQVGLLRAIPSIAFMLLPMVQLGTAQALLKFAPELKKKSEGIAQLLGLISLGVLIGAIIVTILILGFKGQFIQLFVEKSPLINDYIHVIIALIFIVATYSLFETYSRILLKIIAMNVIKEILLRLFTSLLVTLYFLQFLSLTQMVNGLILIYALALLALVLYIAYLGELKISFQLKGLDKDFIKRISNFSLYSMIGASGAYIILNIDQLMVSSMLGLDENGIYTTAFFFAIMIELSKRAILQITTPLISESFENGRLDEIQKMHRQLSINQMIVASLFFIGIVANLDNIYALMPNGDAYSLGKNVVIIIGLAKLIDMTFANNSEIIVMSQYYRFNVITIVCLSGVLVLLNWLFIPIYGIDGAALASLISIFCFNLIKMFFIKWKLKITPFTLGNLKVLVILIVVFSIGYFMPNMGPALVDALIRSAIITLIFVSLVLIFKVSPEVTGIYRKHIKNRILGL
ncbi:lipopolysaccharide biosynthesis protein [Reichenbachiella ulvae]|uniref:Oligosaccharide flippase family protein n=1 Tax=Reichenbachiella ulvae TaxID=2980104 RepID=A0ABT3CPT6_9BACT|nr:oligosaccharide flippase family protein [Reichenbachiella ulvae]MCV9385730.1 oligosaccharide flippase family protein [Reichenbachiella ulvae]